MMLTSWQPNEQGTRELLKFMLAVYGKKFQDQWHSVTPTEMLAVWSMGLSGYTAKEVQRGLAACMTHIWPPTLPEFILWCRPPMDHEAAFSEAVSQLHLRDEGTDSWSHPAIYWAAVAFGSWELRQASWDRAKARWTRILDEQLGKPDLPPVPPRVEALPAPGKATANPEKVRELLNDLRLRIGVKAH